MIFNWTGALSFQKEPVDCPTQNSRLIQFALLHHSWTEAQIEHQFGTYSVLIISFHLKRHLGYFIVQTYLPCMLIVILSQVSRHHKYLLNVGYLWFSIIWLAQFTPSQFRWRSSPLTNTWVQVVTSPLTFYRTSKLKTTKSKPLRTPTHVHNEFNNVLFLEHISRDNPFLGVLLGE